MDGVDESMRRTVALGRSGIDVAPMGWGMWRFAGLAPAAAHAAVDAALEAGCTLFDTADIYGLGTEGGFGAAEALFGRVLRERPGLRAQIVLATKAGIQPPLPYDSSAKYLVAACEASLARLGVEQVDLLQIHRPDLLTHPAEVAAALETLHGQGKIRAAGVSNYTAAQTRALLAHLSLPLATLQPEFSALHSEPLEDGVLDLASEHGIGVLAWSPLAGGRLAGPPPDERAVRVAAVLDELAATHGVSRAAIACAWVMAHPSRPVPLIGAQSPEHVRDVARAASVVLGRRDWYRVLEAARGARMP
jgi:aryl-alcohol dehydrogenase-like predicted oxidoreductase